MERKRPTGYQHARTVLTLSLALMGTGCGAELLNAPQPSHPTVSPAMATAYPGCEIPSQVVPVPNRRGGISRDTLLEYHCGNREVVQLVGNNPDGSPNLNATIDLTETPPNIHSSLGQVYIRENSSTAVYFTLTNGAITNVHEENAIPPFRIPGAPPSPTPINAYRLAVPGAMVSQEQNVSQLPKNSSINCIEGLESIVFYPPLDYFCYPGTYLTDPNADVKATYQGNGVDVTVQEYGHSTRRVHARFSDVQYDEVFPLSNGCKIDVTIGQDINGVVETCPSRTDTTGIPRRNA